MQILALMGSPRKKGNTDVLTDAFLEGAAKAGAEFERVYLNRLKIRGCQACLACRKNGKCSQKDDMQEVYKKLLDADLWVLATPVYWWGPTSQLKAAIDRMYAFDYGDNRKRLEGKRAVIISAFFDEAKEATPYMLGMLRSSIAYLGLANAGELLVRAGEKGEAAKKPKELAKAGRMGRNVAASR